MKTNIKKLYNSRAFWVIISLICSVIMWVYVASVETEEFKQTFRGVRVQLVGETLLRDSKNLVITDMDTSTVTVEVVGPRRIVGSLDSDSLYAQIDVSKLSRAAYTSQQYSVIFPDGTDTSNLTVTRKTPETINFMVSSQTTKSIQVRGSFDGSIADGYTAENDAFSHFFLPLSIASTSAFITTILLVMIKSLSELLLLPTTTVPSISSSSCLGATTTVHGPSSSLSGGADSSESVLLRLRFIEEGALNGSGDIFLTLISDIILDMTLYLIVRISAEIKRTILIPRNIRDIICQSYESIPHPLPYSEPSMLCIIISYEPRI